MTEETALVIAMRWLAIYKSLADELSLIVHRAYIDVESSPEVRAIGDTMKRLDAELIVDSWVYRVVHAPVDYGGEPVDGSGLKLRDHAKKIAECVSPEASAVLCAELRNALIPAVIGDEHLRDKAHARLFALADALADRADNK